ncbi:MAG: hypothetical protein KJ043_20580, partial [Anaerolineae bacterium]|nr:hypothetical protein [Anaerolineae bacterium]
MAYGAQLNKASVSPTLVDRPTTFPVKTNDDTTEESILSAWDDEPSSQPSTKPKAKGKGKSKAKADATATEEAPKAQVASKASESSAPKSAKGVSVPAPTPTPSANPIQSAMPKADASQVVISPDSLNKKPKAKPTFKLPQNLPLPIIGGVIGVVVVIILAIVILPSLGGGGDINNGP